MHHTRPIGRGWDHVAYGDLVLLHVTIWGSVPATLGPWIFLGWVGETMAWVLKPDGPHDVLIDDWSIQVVGRIADAQDVA